MALKYFVLLACVGSVALAQRQSARSNSPFDFDFTLDNLEPKETTTPVPILRYIDTQNNDGSYTYGYESGDGTYKIETRYATGEVKGKYGYYDDVGLFREVEYGAAPKTGFEPTGEGLEHLGVDLRAPQQPLAPVATPAPFVAPTPAPRPAPRAQPAQEEQRDRRVVLRRRPRPQPQPEQEEEASQSRFRNFDRISLPDQRRDQRRENRPSQSRRPDHPRITVIRRPAQEPERPAPRRAPARRPAPTQAPRRPVAQAAIPEQPRFAGPIAQPAALTPDFGGHPAKNINLLTGSYTVSYGR